MGEVVSMQNVETTGNIDSSINSRLEEKAMNGSAEETQNVDSSFLDRSKVIRTLLALESEIVEVVDERNVPADAHKERQRARNLFATSGTDGFRVPV